MKGLHKIDSKYHGWQLIQKKACLTQNIGLHGNLFGGDLLRWIDESAASFISEAIGFKPVVTLKMSEVLFKEPVKTGEIINIDGMIKSIGETSINIDIKVLNVKNQREVCTTEMIFVSVDSDMKPAKI